VTPPFFFNPKNGYGSIPIDTFLVGWTSIYQLFWGSLGTRVLIHPQIVKCLAVESSFFRSWLQQYFSSSG
jgi:hypothetical protein